jgi:hypothetical protein
MGSLELSIPGAMRTWQLFAAKRGRFSFNELWKESCANTVKQENGASWNNSLQHNSIIEANNMEYPMFNNGVCVYATYAW